MLCFMVLAVLLIIGGVEQNSDPVWKLKTPCESYVLGAAESEVRNSV